MREFDDLLVHRGDFFGGQGSHTPAWRAAGIAFLEDSGKFPQAESCSHGTADDGDSRNSPYTASFLKHIQDKDNVSTVFQTISAGVYEQTKGTQVPELSLSFFGEFYLNGKQEKPASPVTAALPPDPCAAAAEMIWRAG